MTTYIINKDRPAHTLVTYETAYGGDPAVANRAAVKRAIGDGHIAEAGTYLACTPDGALLMGTKVEVRAEVTTKLVIV